MKVLRFLSSVVVFLSVSQRVLGDDRPEPGFPPKDIEFFEKKIRPLLHKRCYSCHSGKAKILRGGLRLDHRAGVMTGGDSGPAVVPGDPNKSLLIESVRYGADSMQMPPKGKLPAGEIALLELWVKRGAPFPGGVKVGAAQKAGIDFEAGRKFWSFQPLRRPALPKVEPGQRVRNRIDAFILAELNKRNLPSSPEADRRTLIRRLSFDLTGLPPTPAEIDRFLNDKAPGAYKRLVDRLLASPHYGERWARFWLDLARYTDSTASWLNSTGRAHLYRDWVTQAFNNDMPYDQFVKRQLATDMMPSTGPDDMPALGFLGLSPTYWKELQLPMEIIKVIVADEWEERIDTTSRTFLGLTVACARCHDHKFDPISTKDYYALAGVFASTRLAERPLMPEEKYEPVKRAKSRIKQLDARLKKLRRQKKKKPEVAAEVAALEKQIRDLKKTPHYNAPTANAVKDESLYVVRAGSTPQSGTKLTWKPQPRDLNLFIRGNPNRLGPVVPRRFLRVLSPPNAKPFRNGSGRLELAESIVGDAAPLAARVIVNRIWLAHFGRGLVDTPSNFGTQGSRPSHPELLEDLAARFVENGWSIKWLHREIVNSATYRQTSAITDFGLRIVDSENAPRNHAKSEIPNPQSSDPENRWLWRMNRRRLDVESWRDAMLAVSGTLDRKVGGPSQKLDGKTNHRRTLYGTIHRREMPAMLRLHDFPDPTAHSPQRVGTTTSLQGLFVLNSPLLANQSKALANRMQREVPNDPPGQIKLAYRLLYGREATRDEVRLGMEFLSTGGGKKGVSAWGLYAQVLLGSNEFLFVD